MNMYDKVVKKYKNSTKFYLRIRDSGIIIYKSGRKILGIDKDGIDKDGISMLSINDKYKRVMDYDGTKSKEYVLNIIYNSVKKLMDLGGKFSVCKNHSIKEGKAFSVNDKDILNNLIDELNEDENNIFSFTFNKNSKERIYLTKDNYEKFYEYWYTAVQKSVARKNVHKIDVDLKIELSSDILINNLDEVVRVFEYAVDKGELIFKMNSNILSFDNLKTKSNYDLKVEDKEKSYQQKLMNLLNNKNSKEGIIKNSSLFNENTYPFEMEVYINDKGRIDLTFYEGNKLILCEVKYDEKVIGGSNGLHKHIFDVNIELDNKSNINKFKDNMSKHINRRNKILDNKFEEISIDKLEYIFVLGYSSEEKKELIKSEIKEIKNKTLHKIYLEGNFNTEYILKYPNHSGKNLIEFITDVNEVCPVKFYLTDQSFEKWELLNVFEL